MVWQAAFRLFFHLSTVERKVHNIDGLCDDTIDTSWRPAAPRSKREWNLLIDERWSGRLGLRQGDALSARQLCRLIRERAGDLAGIYPEFPADRVARKKALLEKGIALFLGE